MGSTTSQSGSRAASEPRADSTPDPWSETPKAASLKPPPTMEPRVDEAAPKAKSWVNEKFPPQAFSVKYLHLEADAGTFASAIAISRHGCGQPPAFALPDQAAFGRPAGLKRKEAEERAAQGFRDFLSAANASSPEELADGVWELCEIEDEHAARPRRATADELQSFMAGLGLEVRKGSPGPSSGRACGGPERTGASDSGVREGGRDGREAGPSIRAAFDPGDIGDPERREHRTASRLAACKNLARRLRDFLAGFAVAAIFFWYSYPPEPCEGVCESVCRARAAAPLPAGPPFPHGRGPPS